MSTPLGLLQHEEPSCDDLSVDYDFFTEKVWPRLAHRFPVFEKLKVCFPVRPSVREPGVRELKALPWEKCVCVCVCVCVCCVCVEIDVQSATARDRHRPVHVVFCAV